MTDLITKCNVMAEMNDMIVQSFVIDYMSTVSPMKALELGSGRAGGWSKIQHELGNQTVQWTLVENFHWTGSSYNNETESSWPMNKQQLKDSIINEYPNINIERVYDIDCLDLTDLSDFNDAYTNNIGIMRIDCGVEIETVIKFIINNLTDTGVIVIDDCRMNCGFERIWLALKLIERGFALPVCFGQKETILCKSREYSTELQNLIVEQIDSHHAADPNYGLYYNKEYKVFDGMEWKFITSMNFKIFVASDED